MLRCTSSLRTPVAHTPYSSSVRQRRTLTSLAVGQALSPLTLTSLPPALPQHVTDLTHFEQAPSAMRAHTAGTTLSRTAQVSAGLGMLLAFSACASSCFNSPHVHPLIRVYPHCIPCFLHQMLSPQHHLCSMCQT